MLNPVLFDMDGLLLDTERLCLDAAVTAGAEFGLPDLTDTCISCIGLRSAETAAILTKAVQDRVSYDVFSERRDRLITQQYETGIPLKPGAKELLQYLQGQGHAMAVATSTRTSTAVGHLEQTGLLAYFDHVVGGDQVSNGKPDPEVYHKAAAALNSKASDCYIFEDSDPGTLAAVRSGGRVVQVPDIKPPSANTRALGHIVARDLLAGALATGLMSAER